MVVGSTKATLVCNVLFDACSLFLGTFFKKKKIKIVCVYLNLRKLVLCAHLVGPGDPAHPHARRPVSVPTEPLSALVLTNHKHFRSILFVYFSTS